MDETVIVPPPGDRSRTARVLLGLAGDTPEIVRTARGGSEFIVPSALADLYHEAQVGVPADQPKRRARARSKEE